MLKIYMKKYDTSKLLLDIITGFKQPSFLPDIITGFKQPSFLPDIITGFKQPSFLPDIITGFKQPSFLPDIITGFKQPSFLPDIITGFKQPSFLPDIITGFKQPSFLPDIITGFKQPSFLPDIITGFKQPSFLPDIITGFKQPSFLPNIITGFKQPSFLPDIITGFKQPSFLPDIITGFKQPSFLPELSSDDFDSLQNLRSKIALVITFLGILNKSHQFTCPNPTPLQPAPPTPQFPDSYSTIIEGNVLEQNLTVTALEYFDHEGNRATLKMWQQGILHNLIFDYDNDQLFYVQGQQCTLTDLRQDNNYIFFGKPSKSTSRGQVFSSKNALFFDGTEIYLGQATVRGILVDHWQNCRYWPDLASNFTLDSYFTAQNWSDPINSPQIPVRAIAKGVRNDDGNVFSFNHYYDYVNFQPQVDDPTVFETPKGVICPNRKKTKPVPQLPVFYHYRQEIIMDGDNDIYLADVWYDQELRFIRFDYRMKNAGPPLYTLNPITEVHDYNFGLRYVKDQTKGNCMALPITNASFDVSHNTTIYMNGNKSYVIHMKDPMKMFYLDNNYTYTGQRPKRGLLCDVFTELRNDFTLGDSGTHQAIFEYYFLADGYKMLPDDGLSSPADVPIYLDINVPGFYHAQYNFLDFDEEHPDLSLFDVSSCFSESAKLQFQIRFPGSYKTGTAGDIIRQSRRTFYELMNVSPLRVQDVRLDYDNSQIYVSATLLDRSPPDAQFTLISGKEIERSGDLSYDNSFAPNRSECARLCVNNPGFTCNSFDFCSLDPANTCQLNKGHVEDGKTKLVNSKCDHFSRTVNGPAQQEASISEAYDRLRQLVYTGGVAIQIVLDFQQNPVVYTAVDINVLFGWSTPKQVPSLTGQFSYHLEITVPRLKAVYDSHIYYDDKYKLVRYDLVNTQPTPPLFTVDPITEIHDYNSGLAYTIDHQIGNCSVTRITNNSFDVQFGKDAGYVIKMKNPLDLFYLNGTYRYAGQRTIRGMLCDVFEARRDDFKFGNNPLGQSIFQFYFLSDDWNELAEDSGTPVNSQPIALIISSTQSTFTLTYDFYDFNEQHPDLANFDIRSCFPGNTQKHFLIKFRGNYHPTLDTKLKDFTKQVQSTIAFITGVSPLRFQDPQITYNSGYTYYLGTMVEQAPTILDFTKTSNNVGIYPADRTIDNIMSDFTCAALCRNETSFTCDSFDYCPTAQKCQLSKKHAVSSGPATQSSQICDHYSRTVDSIPNIETSVDIAMRMLKNYVYGTNNFNISIQTDQGNTVTYNAVLFDMDILRPDTQATTSANLQHFIPSRQKVVLLNNDLQFKGVSVDQCASRCLNELTFDCLSFDYCFDTGICLLSHIHPDQNPKLVVTHQMCDLYSRTYLDDYTKYPGQITQTQGDTTISNVYSANYCARMCSNPNASSNQNYTCKSFDYCSNNNMCTLKRTHVLELPTTTLTTNNVCSHYSRKYIHDFTVTKAHDMKTGQSLQFNNMSLDACAKMCVENSGIACKAFSYGTAASSCKLIGVNPANNRGSITNSTVADLYIRQYYPGQNGGNIAGNTNTQQQQQNNNGGSTGYSAGAMAGLAIGMLIPGLVIGAALLYFCRTKRLVEEEQMRMGFVNMSHDNEDHFNAVKTINPADDEPPSHVHQYDTNINHV